jgi:hypothetical protein
VGEVSVRELDALAEARWDFRDGPRWRHPHGFDLGARWDPFPAYAHDHGEAAAAVRRLGDACPPLYDIQVLLADREDCGRTNGWSHLDRDLRGDDGPYLGIIMMAGKRIPPHPAVTRHLAGHEYGHHAEWMLSLARNAKTPWDDQVITEYAQVRGLPPGVPHHGEGGTWHDSPHEIFACDFRLLVAGLEPEYWPHPGIPRPHEVKGLSQWWSGALGELQAARAGRG